MVLTLPEKEKMASVINPSLGKVGWIWKKRKLGRPRRLFFQTEFSTDVVSYFTDDVSRGPTLSKLVGSFSVSQATIEARSVKRGAGSVSFENSIVIS